MEAQEDDGNETPSDRARFLILNAKKLSSWISSLLHRPRIVSPMKFDMAGQPNAGDTAVRKILTYLVHLDNRLREGEYTRSSGGISVEDLTTSHNFENLIALAIKQELYVNSS